VARFTRSKKLFSTAEKVCANTAKNSDEALEEKQWENRGPIFNSLNLFF